jgi:hypothetical protein
MEERHNHMQLWPYYYKKKGTHGELIYEQKEPASWDLSRQQPPLSTASSSFDSVLDLSNSLILILVEAADAGAGGSPHAVSRCCHRYPYLLRHQASLSHRYPHLFRCFMKMVMLSPASLFF